MKNLTAKYLSLVMLATLLGSNAHASREDGYMNNGGDCCPRQYECGCNPLYCGAWDLQIQAGVNPIIWRNRGPIQGVNCTVSSTSPVVTLFNEAPKFSSLYKLPWIVGGQVGYAMSDNSRVYLEFNYSQAKAKSDVLINTDLAPIGAFTFSFGKYKLFEGYVGARYYWDRWCDHLSFFLGGKVGFTHHKKQSATILIAIPSSAVATPLTDIAFNNNNTVLSGGANFGLDYCICGNWSLVLTGEVVASCAPRGVGYIPVTALPSQNGLAALFTPSIGTELRFPVTLAVRYSF